MKTNIRLTLLIIYTISVLFHLCCNTRIRSKSSSRAKSKIDDVRTIYEDSDYGDALEAIGIQEEKLTKKEESQLKKDLKKGFALMSDIDLKPDDSEISANANAFNKDSNPVSLKAFVRLNRIADIVDGKEALKKNSNLKQILKAILSNKSKSPELRVMAAKLSARIYDIPTTFQYTNENALKPAKNLSSYIAVPRIRRLYENDKYIENYRAGNWEP